MRRSPAPSPPAATGASTSHRPDIQGLRAVAVLLVVLAHAGVPFLPGGFVGVDVFFVLSGFLITSLLLAEARANGSISLADFYVRRARRILPAAALTLLVTDVAAFLVLNFLRAQDAAEDSLYALGFAANFRFAERGVDYFAESEPPSPLLHYWSLSVEEQFYLVWPLLLSLALFGATFARRRGRSRPHHRRLLLVVVLVGLVSLGWSIQLTATLPATAYFSPFTRAWELAVGAALAAGATTLGRVPPPVRLAMGWAGLAAIAVAAVAYSERTPFPGSAALLPTIGTALAIAAGLGDRPPRLAVARPLALRPMCVVGDRSYAFYLWHWPVLILADQYVGYELPPAAKLGLLVGAFLLSCVSYALVENPLRRVRTRRATGCVAAVSTAAVVATAVLSLAAAAREQHEFEVSTASATVVAPASFASVRTTAATRGALPEVVAAVEAARRGAPIPPGLTPPIGRLRDIPAGLRPPDGCISSSRSPDSTSRICRLGATKSSKLIVLIGDSHALMWLPAILELARRDGWAVIPLLRLGCRPDRWGTDCGAWHRWTIREATRLRPSITLLGGNIGERQTPTTRAGTDAIVAAAKTLGSLGDVVVIGDPEGLTRSPVDCLLARRATMATCTTTWPRASLAIYDGVAARTAQVGAGFLRTRGLLCFERRCPAVIGRTIAYMDNNHVTAAYARRTAGAFRAALGRAAPQAFR